MNTNRVHDRERSPRLSVALIAVAALALGGAACDPGNVTDQTGRVNHDLRITQTAITATVPEGGNAGFVVTVTNLGPGPVDEIIAGDTLTSGLSYLTHTTSTGTFDPATRIWSIGELAADEQAVLTMYARAEDGTDGSTHANTVGVVSLSDTQNDSVPDNNTHTQSISISGNLPPTAFQNEPPGFTALTNNFWSQHVGNGWTYTGVDPSGAFTHVVTSGYGDPPPVGGPSVLEAVYNEGQQGGSGPGRTGYTFGGGGRNELFVGMWHKFAADYPGSPVYAGNKMFFMLVGGGRSYFAFQQNTARSFELALEGFEPVDGLASAPLTLIPYGSWYKLEWYMKRNDAGESNGIARMWLNGVMLMNRTDLEFPGAITAFYIEGTNNGASGSIVPADGRWWMAQTYISAP